MYPCLNLSNTFASLPPEWPEDPLPEIRQNLDETPDHKLIVLDDDPTGTQTVKDIPVVTNWKVSTLLSELKAQSPGFFILTNSRSLNEIESRTLHQEIASNIRQALAQLDRETNKKTVTIISRSDSTLRGHYPLETDVISEELDTPDVLIIAPYFEEGNRYTINDVHYLTEHDTLVPVGATPFAKDKSFGYTQSHLPSWVEEKTNSKISASSVTSLSLEELRLGGPDEVCQTIASLPRGSVCVANAACPRDIEVLALATLRAEKKGIKILFRSAASIVSARLGQRPQDSLTTDQLTEKDAKNGGLTIIGSYVSKTTAQLDYLLSTSSAKFVEISVEDLLAPEKAATTISHTSEVINTALSSGSDVVAFTSRTLVSGINSESSLAIGRAISDALVSITQQINEAPRYLIAKGGITSSDIATKALRISRAIVLGHAIPGVPVWQLGHEAKFPGMNYIIFPGNVGTAESLGDLISSLQLAKATAPN
ncbi:hypothetical protein MLD52_13895 [Puniceicoccaceae bacterium K14]|nr:hypothetical protein [Puniceicoccaceae bacterium K14]